MKEEVGIFSVKMAKTTMEYDLLASVPGLGDATIVDLLSEEGSFSLYENPRQLIKLAGLTLRENSSGQHKGQKHSLAGLCLMNRPKEGM